MKNPRTDGEESRQRLLDAALACFAQNGYANTSTREIAESAGVNIAAISYYFGDKAGLYRAAFTEPMGTPQDDIVLFDGKDLTLKQALRGLYKGFIEPLKQGKMAQQCIRLHMREMVEPTGLWQEEIDHGIKPYHAALVKVLCRHFDTRTADDELHSLAVCIVALGVHMYIGRDVIAAVRPQLTAKPSALDDMAQRLVMYALAMVSAEKKRRAKVARTAIKTRKELA